MSDPTEYTADEGAGDEERELEAPPLPAGEPPRGRTGDRKITEVERTTRSLIAPVAEGQES